MSPRLPRLGAFVLVVALALPASTPRSDAAPLRLVGSDLLGPAAAAELERFGRESDIELAVDFSGTRPGLARLQAGGADLGLFAFPPGEVPPGEPLVSRAIAFQPIVVVVPDSMPLTQITLGQLRGAFASGSQETLATWGDLGLTGEWRNRPVVPLAPAPSVALSLELTRRLVFPGAEFRPTLVQVPDLAALPLRLQTVGGGIALTPVIPAPGSGLRALALARSLTDPAYQPTADRLRDGYALRLPLYIVFRRDTLPRIFPVLNHLLGPEMREVLARAHFLVLPEAAGRELLFELETLR